MQRYELIEGSSAKFWAIERSGSSLVTSWGRIGTAGQSKTKAFASPAEAKAEEASLVAEKTRKGYQPVGVAAPTPAQSTKSTTKPAAAKPATAKPATAKPATAKPATAKPAATKPVGAAQLDGSTNRFVDASGERVDLRVAEGDYPTSIPVALTGSGNVGEIVWSPIEARLAVGTSSFTECAGVRLLAEGPDGWTEHVIGLPEFQRTSMVWSPDGRSLFVGFEGQNYTKKKGKALVATFDVASGKETARFSIPNAPFHLRIHPNGRDLLVSMYTGTSHYDTTGRLIGQLSKGELSLDPSGEWAVHNTRDDGRYIAGRDGKPLLQLQEFCRDDWFGPGELCAYLRAPKPGLYRIVLTRAKAPELRFLGAATAEPREDLRVSPDGRFIGILNKGPATLDVYDATTGARVRQLRFPKGKSETYFTFAPDGRIAGTVGWQKVIHLYGTEPKFGVTLRSAPSEADKRKVSEKFFETAELASRNGEKQIAALTAKGFKLESIEPKQSDDDRERLEVLRRIHAGPLSKTAKTAFVPVLGPKKTTSARATRFRASPILSPGETGVLCPHCTKPMACLAELDLQSVPEASGLRGDGVVQVFYCLNTKPDCVSATEAWLPGKGRSKLVRMVKGAGKAAPSSEGLEVIEWLPELDTPDAEDLEGPSGMKPAKAIKAAKIDEWPDAVGGDKIGGYPAWVQPPEYPKCSRCKNHLTELVLQLGSNGAAGVQFGDIGTAYVLRCPTHEDELELISQSH